jgi:hypothetical protein
VAQSRIAEKQRHDVTWAIPEMNRSQVGGRSLTVNEARMKQSEARTKQSQQSRLQE